MLQSLQAKNTFPSQEIIKKLPKDGGKKYNRLVFEKSPYLLQHCENPVDWYPWGQDAFDKAKKENKPIFLSVGYSSCHWCHVMEKDSFEKSEVAKVLNEHYVSIKVDREERPDIDSVYMAATQIIKRGHGGWPNSVWLNSDKQPWYAATYVPKKQFISMLLELSKAYKEQSKDIQKQADMISRLIKESSYTSISKVTPNLNPKNQVEKSLVQQFEHFSSNQTNGPKFPPHRMLEYALSSVSLENNTKLLASIEKLMETMALGGIHDQVGGGFARYSTDGKWFLPHFEKMLYDNAQLAYNYTLLYQKTNKQFYKQTAIEILEFIMRDMSQKEGGYFSAFDADSDGEEGKFYLFSTKQIEKILGESASEFSKLYNITKKGNYTSEIGEESNGNIPFLNNILIKNKKHKEWLKKLRLSRETRVWPLLDDKVLVSWNGLMIKAFAFASKVFEEKKYLNHALKSVQFIQTKMIKNGRLYHSSRLSETKSKGFLEDYALFVQSLITIHKINNDSKILNLANTLTSDATELFNNKDGGFYFSGSDNEELLSKEIGESDNVTPSSAGVFIQNLIYLSQKSKNNNYLKIAKEAISFYFSFANRSPSSSISLIQAYNDYLQVPQKKLPTKQKKPWISKTVAVQKFPVAIQAKYQDNFVTLQIEIEEGWHINSNEPLQDYLIPTSIINDSENLVKLGTFSYPESRIVEMEFADEEIDIFEGNFKIKIPITFLKNKGPFSLTFSTQACSEEECMSPEKLKLQF